MAKRKFISSPVAKAEKYTKELINGERGKGDNKEKLTEGQTAFRLGYRTAVNDTRKYRKLKANLRRRKANRPRRNRNRKAYRGRRFR